MADPEKIRLMARLAMLEEHCGRRIRKAENTSRIDLITNPVWRRGFAVSVLFFAGVLGLAALNTDMVLNAVANDQTKNLIMIVLIAWLSLLAITVVISLVLSYSRTRRVYELRDQYRQMLEQLERSSRMDGRHDRRRRDSFEADDLWDEPSRPEKRRRSSRGSEENLDYRRMEVLEFEDDDYCYYVEAVPKKSGGGRRG